jgi:hypothetical protein
LDLIEQSVLGHILSAACPAGVPLTLFRTRIALSDAAVQSILGTSLEGSSIQNYFKNQSEQRLLELLA